MKNVDLKSLNPRPFYWNGGHYPVDVFVDKINWLSTFKNGDLVFFSSDSEPKSILYFTDGRFKRDGRFKKARHLDSPYLGHYKSGFYKDHKFLFIRFGVVPGLNINMQKHYAPKDWCGLAFPVVAYVMSLSTGHFYCAEDFTLFHMKKI